MPASGPGWGGPARGAGRPWTSRPERSGKARLLRDMHVENARWAEIALNPDHPQHEMLLQLEAAEERLWRAAMGIGG